MATRLEILQNSLEKKEARFTEKLEDHFNDVKSGNGQPMNDKRNGHATLRRWDKQNDSLRNIQAAVEITKNAIENEISKQAHVCRITERLPEAIKLKIQSGELLQWKKFPNMFFVPGVEKARIVWEIKKGFLAHRYLSEVLDGDQRQLFATCFNSLLKLIKDEPKT